MKLTDYPLFKNLPNFKFDSLYNMFHYFNENLNGEMNIPIKKHTLEKEKLYSCMQQKMRPHRLYFFKKLMDTKLYKHGYITGTKFFFDEYKDASLVTDNNYLQNKYYYEKDNWDFFDTNWEDYKDVIIDNFDKNICHNHTDMYNNSLDYDLSYIDICGETHILFDTEFPTFTEKAIQPILFEKMFILYGGNKFYKVLEELGCDNYFKELGLPQHYHEIESPYEQADLIIDALHRLTTLKFTKIFEQSQVKIQKNKKIILEHYKNILVPIYKFMEIIK